jgi:subtilisin family serine protease
VPATSVAPSSVPESDVQPVDVSQVAAEIESTPGPDDVAAIRQSGSQLEVLEAVVDDTAELDQFAAQAAAGGEVRAIEVALEYTPAADPLRVDQWALDAVRFEAVHSRTTGTGVVVAVLDTAIGTAHPELSGRLAMGWDAIDERTYDPADPARGTGDGDHGTHVAGIIAARTGNGIGIHGAAPGVTIQPVRVIQAGGGLSSDVAEGLIWAADNGADVVNISLTATAESDLVSAAIDYALGRDVAVVASAGNLANQGNPRVWPAADPDVLAVGAVDQTGAVWANSSRGSFVDVVAPGVAVLSLAGRAAGYVSMTGTSQAAPHATALVALMRSAYPELSQESVRGFVATSAHDLGEAGPDNSSGSGLIDPEAALQATAPAPVEAPGEVKAMRLADGGTRLRWTHSDPDRVGFEVLAGGQVVASLAPDIRSYRVEAPDPARPPRYQVRTVGPRGARSAAVGVAPAPTGIVAVAGSGSVTLSWPAVSPRPEAMAVLRDGTVVGVVPGTRSSFDDAGTGPATRRYQVAQVVAGIMGDPSTPVSATPGQSAPVSRGGPKATVSGNTVRLAWPAASGAVTGYRVERDGAVIANLGAVTAFDDRNRRAGPAAYRVTAVGPGGAVALGSVRVTVPRVSTGYHVLTSWGRVLSFGSAPWRGNGAPTGAVVAGVATPSGAGYWVVHTNGRVEAFGDAVWYGDASTLRLAAPVVAMEATSDGRGYWLLAADGGVFTYGNARFFGSTGGLRLAAPVRDMAATPTGNGYWFVAADGGVFTFGDARFSGSTGGLRLDAPVVSMAPGPTGYWLIAADGGVFAFGSPFYGSLPGTLAHVPPHERPRVVRMRPVNGATGYLLLASDGGIFSYGSPASRGSAWRRLGSGERVVDLLVVDN